MFKNTEFDAWTFQSFTTGTEANVFDIKFPSFAIKCDMLNDPVVKKKAFKEIAKYIAWCHEHLLVNEGPDVDYDGSPFPSNSIGARLRGQALLPDGWRAAFLGCKSDSKARVSMNHFSRNYSCTLVCEACLACQGHVHAPLSLLYADFGSNAMWRNTVGTHETYMSETAAHDLSCWSEVPGWRIELAWRDWMHNDYLGAGRDHLGSLAIDLLRHGRLGHGPADRQLKQLWIEFAGPGGWCKRNGISSPPGSFSKRKFGRTTNKEYPMMSSSFKACHMKLLTAFFSEKASAVCEGSTYSKMRATSIWALANCQHIMDTHGLILDSSASGNLRASIYLWLQSYQWLAHTSQTDNSCLYYIRPKFHYIDHIAMDIDLSKTWNLNPRFLSCMADESFLGKLMKIGKKCHASSASLRLLQRWILFIAIRWQKRRRSQRWYLQ